MDFGTALRAMQEGQRVQRTGWNGKGMWLALWREGTYSVTSEALANCPALQHLAGKARSKSIDVCASIVMKTADGSIVFGWLASQTDMLATDWRVLDDSE